MAALTVLVRSELRSRWPLVVGLTLLVGVATAVVLGAAAGARRTADVYDRFAQNTATRDVGLQIDAEDPAPILSEIESSDLVASSGRAAYVPVVPDPDSTSDVELDYVVSMSSDGAWGFDIDRSLVLEGRLPDPADPSEVLANETAAEQAGVAVGDRLELTAFTPAEFEAAYFRNEFEGFSGPVLEVEVVGIGRAARALEGSDIAAGAEFVGTPALLEQLGDTVGRLDGLLAVRLAAGASFDDVRAVVADAAGDVEYDITSADEDFADSARQVASVFSTALWAFAAVALAAACAVVGGAISRAELAARTADPVISAIGGDRRARFVARGAIPAIGSSVGVALGVIGALLVSPLFPIGVTRRMEPDPGIRVDAAILFAGGALALAGCLAWVAVAARRHPRPETRVHPSRWASIRSSMPPVMAIGLSHALSPRSDGRGAPVRAALLASIVGVVGVVGAATVVRSIDALVADPGRYGWDWSSEPDVGEEDLATVATAMAREDGIDATAIRQNRRVELDGLVTGGMSFHAVEGEIDAVIESGRTPLSDDEVALGPETLDALGVSVGDEVTARTTDGALVRLVVVGIAITAPVESNETGVGAVLTPRAIDRVARSGGYDSLLLRYEDGVDVAALERRLADEYPIGYSVYSRVDEPGWLQHFVRAVPIVSALGGFFALLGLAGVAHALAVGTRRRRGDLATLRALGMRRRDVRSSIRWGAVATVAIGLVVGVPLGIVVGRGAWQMVISGQAALDDPTLPVLVLTVLAPVTVALALVLTWLPARSATRDLVTDLRAE